MNSPPNLRPFAFPFFVLLPTLLYLGYVLVFAQPTFETEAKLIVRENRSNGGTTLPGPAAALLGLGHSSALEDAMILEHYLHSADLIELADAKLRLRDHFKTAPSDPFRRLRENAESETFYQFFRKMVSVKASPETGILALKVRAFHPDAAHDLADFIIAQSERVINQINDRLTASQTTVATRELEKSEQRLRASKETLLAFQIENAVVDPESESAARLTHVAALDSRLIEKQTALRTKSNYLRADAFELRVLLQEIQALEAQRLQETGRLASSQDASMVKTLQAYETLRIEHEFSLTAYATAIALFESATSEAARQGKFLLPIANPHVPERPVFPRPVQGTATVFVLACAAYGIGRLVFATIREHSI